MRSPALILGACLLLGCAGAGAKRAPDDGRVLLQVPFFPDTSDQCGPSALASVLGYWGKAAYPTELKKQLYRPSLKGVLTVDMLLAAKGRGLPAEMANGSVVRIKKELDAGRPVIAFVNVGFRFYPIGHYLVITGYDEGRQLLYVHSGARRNLALTYAQFESQWEKTERWTLFILPPRD
ncbi:MAG: C39 family peptidase [Elusimicrobiota bacterium]